MVPPRPVRVPPWLGLVLLLAGSGAGLVLTNPDPAAFEEYAGLRLSRLLREELCEQNGLPLMLRLVIRDCPALVEAQRPALGRLARLQTRRRNLGVLSLYVSTLGGQQLLPDLRLPRYHALTLAVAGQFLVLRASALDAEGVAERQAWLPGDGI